MVDKAGAGISSKNPNVKRSRGWVRETPSTSLASPNITNWRQVSCGPSLPPIIGNHRFGTVSLLNVD